MSKPTSEHKLALETPDTPQRPPSLVAYENEASDPPTDGGESLPGETDSRNDGEEATTDWGDGDALVTTEDGPTCDDDSDDGPPPVTPFDPVPSPERRDRPQAPPGNMMEAFYRLLSDASALAEGDIPGGRNLLREAIALKLPSGEMAVLRGAITEATGYGAAVVRAMANDAANFREGHGYIDGVEDLSRAFEAHISAGQGSVVACEGVLWLYAVEPSPSLPESQCGYYRMMTVDEADSIMLTAFGDLPAVRKKADRVEAFRRVYVRHERSAVFFSSAAPGVNLRNGFLRLDQASHTVELLPHDPAHRARFKLDVDHRPGARADRFMEGLMRIVDGDRAKARCLLQFVAATLFGFMPAKDPVRSVALLFGPQRTGKSTVIRLVQRFVPPHTQSAIPPELWGDERHRARLRNIRLNSVTELDFSGKAISGHHFKLIASHEPVTAREVYSKAVTFTPQALHLFACNGLPVIGERDASLERRLIVLRFAKTLTDAELDPNFLDRVWDDAPGILNLIAEEAEALWRDGRFTLPDDNLELILRMQYRDRPEDILARLWIEAAPGESITSADLQVALRFVADQMGCDTTGWDTAAKMRRLSSRLNQLYGATRHATNGRPFYDGVRFKAAFAGVPQPPPSRPTTARVEVNSLDDL